MEPHLFKSGAKAVAESFVGRIILKPLDPFISKGIAVLGASPAALTGTLFLLTSQPMGSNDETVPKQKVKYYLNNIPKDISPQEASYIKSNYSQYYKDYNIGNRINYSKRGFDKNKTDLEVIDAYGDKKQKEENARILGTVVGGFLCGALAKGISKTIVKKSENLNIGKLFEKVKTAPVIKNYYNVIGTTKEENFKIRNITSKYDDFYGYEYNAYTNPGPLAELNDHPNLNFYGGRYNSRVLTEDTIYYRAGDANNKYGRYFVEIPPKSVIQVRMDTAVKPYWTNKRTGMWEKNDLGIDISGKSKIEKIYTVRVPAGTVIYEGPVAPQGGMYLGGMEINQIFLPDTRLPGIEFFEYVK